MNVELPSTRRAAERLKSPGRTGPPRSALTAEQEHHLRVIAAGLDRLKFMAGRRLAIDFDGQDARRALEIDLNAGVSVDLALIVSRIRSDPRRFVEDCCFAVRRGWQAGRRAGAAEEMRKDLDS